MASRKKTAGKGTVYQPTLFEIIGEQATHLKEEIIAGKDLLLEAAVEKIAAVKDSIRKYRKKKSSKRTANNNTKKKNANNTTKKNAKKVTKKVALKKTVTAKKKATPKKVAPAKKKAVTKKTTNPKKAAKSIVDLRRR
jgi:hypothetical protein